MAKEKKQDYINDWAYSNKYQKNIHISEAESGLNEYRCLGCHTQMVANIQKKNPHWQSYFSHYATDINKEKVECVRASRVYREKIARAILNELKYVNAPAIYKYPPKSELDLLPMKIDSGKKVTASYTKPELSFFEDENGEIKWGANTDVIEKNLLIRPDVTFFNKKEEPILFVEFIVDNKITQEKFLKLSRLGIDTLQINIPKKAEAEIEIALKSSRTYKWVYNEKEANTEYIPVSRTNSEEFSQINDNERVIFEEDFKCRQAEINQLIRSIKRSLRSEQYRGVEHRLNEQIQQVERNAEVAKQRLEDLEESNRRDALARNSIEEDKEDKEYADLEKRYLTKKRELEETIDIASFNQGDRRGIIDDIENEKAEIKRIKQEAIDSEIEIRERLQIEFDEHISREKREICNLEETIRTSIDRELVATNFTIESLGVLYDDIPRTTAGEFEFLVGLENKEIRQLETEEKGLEDKIFREFSGKIKFEESEIKRIRREEGSIEESARKEFDREIKNNARGLSKEFTNLLEVQGLGHDYKEFKLLENRYKSARKFLAKRTW